VGDVFDVPMTAHFLGGCAISDDPATGGVDPYHRVHGHPGISVVDGSAVSANLGVNPSPTITAQAERAFSLWPTPVSPTCGPRRERRTAGSTPCGRCGRPFPRVPRRRCR